MAILDGKDIVVNKKGKYKQEKRKQVIRETNTNKLYSTKIYSILLGALGPSAYTGLAGDGTSR